MATPVFSVQNQASPTQSLYWIHDTFTELPWSIPMDLTTFIHLHLCWGRSFEGLIACWPKLKQTGSSLSGSTLNDHYPNNRLQAVMQHYEDAEMAPLAQQHDTCSRDLDLLLNDAHGTQMASAEFGRRSKARIEEDPTLIFRHPDYALSTTHLWRWFHDHFPDLIEDIDLLTTLPSTPLQDLFDPSEEDGEPPLCWIPHRLRNHGFFRAQCIALDREFLIPYLGVDDPWENKELMLELITYVDPLAYYSRISQRLQHDKDIIRHALETNPYCLQLLDSSDLENPELAAPIQEAQYILNQADENDSPNVASRGDDGDDLPF